MKSKGFTLIELLVVIAIISILSVIGFATYQAILKNSRDFKRNADLKTIQSALEQYRADQLYYPMREIGASCNNGTFNFNCSFKSPGGGKKYLERIPSDPITSNVYPYLYTPLPDSCNNSTSTKCTNYCLYAAAENSVNFINVSSCPDDSHRELEMTQP